MATATDTPVTEKQLETQIKQARTKRDKLVEQLGDATILLRAREAELKALRESGKDETPDADAE